MDPQYTCSTCKHYSSASSEQGICKRYPQFDTPKQPTNFCGNHSQFNLDFFGLGGGGASGIVNAGALNQMAFYAAAGTAVSGSPTIKRGTLGQLNLSPLNNTSPVEGDIWADTNQGVASIYSGGIKQFLSRGIYNQVIPATALANPTTYTSLLTGNTAIGTLIIPSSFWVVGKTLVMEGWIIINPNIASQVDVGLFLGGTKVIGIITAAAISTSVTARFLFALTCKATGASGSIIANGLLMTDTANATITINLTGSLTLDLQFRFLTAAALHTVSANGAMVTVGD